MSADARPVATPDTLFTQEAIWQSWLDVEAALARVQARMGMIPDWAATGIAEAARLDVIGVEDLKASIAVTQAPVLSLTRLLAERAGKAGDYVHWGATTQNVIQTGRILLMRQADAQIRAALAQAFENLAALAETHAETPMAGRTNRRHALPITFGFKAASWIEELDRAAERLEQSGARLFALPFGGAVGAMHSWQGEGPALYAALAEELGLAPLVVPSRTVNDLFADYVTALALLAMSIERAAAELYRLMAEEVGEVSETQAPGVVGSSTMPHKVNPKAVVKVLALCTRLRAQAAPAMEAGRPSHEADAACNGLISTIADEACVMGWKLTRSFARLAGGIAVHPARMERNLAMTGPAIASENLMMALAPLTGRARAHDILHHVIETAPEDIGAALAAEPDVAAHFSADEVAALLDVPTYTGESAPMARAAAALGRATAARLRND